LNGFIFKPAGTSNNPGSAKAPYATAILSVQQAGLCSSIVPMTNIQAAVLHLPLPVTGIKNDQDAGKHNKIQQVTS
jgi:hypothetical protein